MRRSSRPHRASASVLAGAALSLVLAARVSAAPDDPLWPDREEIERFLKKADVKERRKVGTGVTNPEKVTLELGGTVRHAVFKDVDERSDNWRNEVAAYELDKVLGIGMVPPTVERSVAGRRGCLQLWVIGATLDEHDVSPPDIETWRDEVSVMWLFDDLIANVDRHLNNAMVSPAGRLILIDNSRSFRDRAELVNDLNARGTGTHARFWGVEYDPFRDRFETRYPPALLERLRTVTDDEVEDALGRWVWGWRRKLVLDRRKRILERLGAMSLARP